MSVLLESFCGHMFSLSKVNAQEWTIWFMGQAYVELCKELPNNFLQQLHHFIFLPAVQLLLLCLNNQMGEMGVGWERGPRRKGSTYTQSWFTLLYSRNQHSIVKQFSLGKKSSSISLTRQIFISWPRVFGGLTNLSGLCVLIREKGVLVVSNSQASCESLESLYI